jgi:hypothetical protein
MKWTNIFSNVTRSILERLENTMLLSTKLEEAVPLYLVSAVDNTSDLPIQ